MLNKLKIIFVFLGASFSSNVWSSSFKLDNAVLKYEISYPLHNVHALSKESKGKGVCEGAKCQFLVGVPAKSFDSDNSNRDTHMQQTVKSAEFPIITVGFETANPPKLGEQKVDLEINFAGIKNKIMGQKFIIEKAKDNTFRSHGIIQFGLDQFKITKPSLLGVSINNHVKVDVDTHWLEIKN
jgi:hypothetical protein